MNIVDQIAVRAVAGRLAVVADDEELRFGELLSRAFAVADWLQGCAGFPGNHQGRTPRIGLACGNGVEYIILALGILKAGACLVPIADELAEPERMDLIARTGLCGWVLGSGVTGCRGQVAASHLPTGAGWIPLQTVPLDCETEFSALNPAFIRFSSGTTGDSKGVVISHQRLEERITSANAGLRIGSEDRVLWMLPMAHHFAVSIILYLYHGACTVIGMSHLAEEVLKTAAKTGATVIYGSPFHYALLAADRSSFVWPSLRLAVSTAAPLTEAAAAAFHTRFGKPLVQGFGIIEIGLPLLNHESPTDAPTSVGRPLPAYRAELRNENGACVAHGELGELWISGPGMFDAYLSPWLPCHDVCSDAWFSTGDLAAADESGRLFIQGRKKSVINVGGMKVFPEEVEAIMGKHPAVARCRVRGVQHAVLGSIPVADVLLAPEEAFKPRELIQWCRKSLSAYKVPAKVQAVESLPLTASGKIRRA